MKACFRCNEEKPLIEFYRHPGMADGHLGKCKACTRAENRANRQKRADYYRSYDVARYQHDPRRRRAVYLTTARRITERDYAPGKAGAR